MSEQQNVVKYTNISDIENFWVENIAPNYFDMDNINNYRTGIFGYINEVMANTTEDAFNAVNVARQEFYPITAQFIQSLYKMAAVQKLNLPLAIPATAKAALVIPESEIIERSTYNNGIYSLVIDNTIKLMADNIPFMLDYPIIIISKKTATNWIHTCHYDVTVSSSISGGGDKYIMNKTIVQNGVRYLILSVNLRQMELQKISEVITKDSSLETTTLEFLFNGSLANFEVFYRQNSSSTEIQLKKVPHNAVPPKVPFVYYELINDNKIRLIFKSNPYFVPAFNSEIMMNIYTSLGTTGNFDVFKGSLVSEISSEKYPYNDNMTITGLINGSSSGGVDKLTKEQFRRKICDAYATNNTITTSNDLQIYFDEISRINDLAQSTKVMFRKKRDDALIRLFGAYALLKDTNNVVIPTNTLNVDITKNEITTYEANANRLVIKPGTLFEYKPNLEDGTIVYSAQKCADKTLVNNLDIYDDDSRFIFTNPFLIGITLDPNIIGYYLNSVNTIRPVEYTYVNDNTLTQFIASNLRVNRNALSGEDFYKISLSISPASDLDVNTIIDINDPTDEANIIRAKNNGRVISCNYKNGAIFTTIQYEDTTTEDIQVNNTIVKEIDGTFSYTTGYNMNFNVGDTFLINDALATKKVTDKGKIRALGDFREILYPSDLCIPFCIESYNAELNTYEIASYITTNDLLSFDANILIEHGIYNNYAGEDTNVSIPMQNLLIDINIFYLNPDINYTHKYSTYDYVKSYTLSNTYSLNANDPEQRIALVQQIDFIRSTLSYSPGPVEDPDNYTFSISEIPLVKANWAKKYDNFNYLVKSVYNNYKKLYETYFLLENNFGIDLKFYNTYGKARFFTVGIKDDISNLDSVTCSFSFGIYLTSLTSSELFITKFRNYIKDYVESINYDTNRGQSVYIMNMIADLKTEFPEIGYIEYYGFNKYDHKAQKIEGLSNTEIIAQGITDYIPEFINIKTAQDGNVIYPKVDITLLDN